MFVQTSLVAYAERVLVVASGVGTDELFVARLIRRSVAGDVVVIARESEAVLMTADKSGHREWAVTARRATVNHNQVNVSHGRVLLESGLAALHEERADDGGEYGDDELDDGLPSFQVFKNLHNR